MCAEPSLGGASFHLAGSQASSSRITWQIKAEAVPAGGFFFKLRAANAREGVELGAAIVLAGLPFRGDPAFLFEFVERRIERAVADLQHVTGDLGAQAYGVAVHGLEGEDFDEEQVEGAL